MARSPVKRSSKYRRKFDEEHVARQLKLARDEMLSSYAEVQADLTTAEETAREIIGAHGVPTVSFPAYLNFTRQVWKAKRSFPGETLKREVQILIDKWKARKLDEAVLDDIRFNVFAIDKPKP